MAKQLYAVVLSATRTTPKVINDYHIMPWAVFAANRYEAIGIGVAAAKNKFPPDEGWRDHSANECCVSTDLIKEELGLVDAPKKDTT